MVVGIFWRSWWSAESLSPAEEQCPRSESREIHPVSRVSAVSPRPDRRRTAPSLLPDVVPSSGKKGIVAVDGALRISAAFAVTSLMYNIAGHSAAVDSSAHAFICSRLCWHNKSLVQKIFDGPLPSALGGVGLTGFVAHNRLAGSDDDFHSALCSSFYLSALSCFTESFISVGHPCAHLTQYYLLISRRAAPLDRCL